MFVLSGTVLEFELTVKINVMGIFYSNMKRTVLEVQSIVRHANLRPTKSQFTRSEQQAITSNFFPLQEIPVTKVNRC